MPMAEYATSWQTDSIAKKCRVKKVTKKWGAPPYQSCSFLDIVQTEYLYHTFDESRLFGLENGFSPKIK